jgi:membrane protease YdiL (CAAX protease family)
LRCQAVKPIMKNKLAFTIYLFSFFIAWTGYVLWIYPWMTTLGDHSIRYAFVNISIRFVVWVAPVFLFLRYIDHVGDALDYLQLKYNWRRGVLVGVVFAFVILFGTILLRGLPDLHKVRFTWNSFLSTTLLIGVVEEIPFRGFILRKFQEQFDFWLANLFSSILFLGMHLPGWITLHIFKWQSAISVFLLGVIFSIVVRLTRSLWSSIIAHGGNNFVNAVLFRL